MLQRQTVLQLVQQNGPVLPKDISQTTRENMLFVSAMLSELVSAKKIKYSHLKVGSSPLYYYEGQEEKLQNYSEKLPSHLKEAYSALRDGKVLKDSAANARIRAGLRELKDFAQGFTRTTEEGKELFWKWYMLSNEDATSIVREKFSAPKKEEETVTKEEPPKKVEEKPAVVKVEKPVEKITPAEVKKEVAAASETVSRPEPVTTTPEPSVEKEVVKEKPTPVTPTETKPSVSNELEQMRKMLEEERKKLEKEREQFLAEKRKLAEKNTPDTPKEPDYTHDILYQQIAAFFATKDLTMLDTEIIKKNTELSGRVRVGTTVGDISFFVRAKSKKRLTKKDFEELHSFALEKKHPVLLVLQTELPRKTYSTLKEEYPLLSPLVLDNGSKDN